ncbi:unnamed protein product, partial [Lymnaea stagnalis]
VLSDGSRKIYEIVNLEFLCIPIALFGIVSNIINITIFYKQGLRYTVNIGLTGLAISDLGSLVVIEWYNVCFNPFFAESGIPLVLFEFQHLTAGVPHLCFTRITGWITVYITAERCLCIVTPLRVKRLLTPARSALIICSIYAFTALTLLPEYMSMYIDWKFYPESNRTLLGLIQNSSKQNLNGLTSFLYGVYMLVVFAAVGLLTAILVAKLKRKSLWRRAAASDANQSGAVSSRDAKAMRVVISIAISMIVLFTPSVLITIYTFVEPEFGISGALSNVFLVAWSFALLFEVVNSSFTIVLYFFMSSKFRKCFHEL